METTTLHPDRSAQEKVHPDTRPNEKSGKDVCTASDYLRIAAERRERRGEKVTALLFRNEAYRLELPADSERPL
jgi:hypothetical protein